MAFLSIDLNVVNHVVISLKTKIEKKTMLFE